MVRAGLVMAFFSYLRQRRRWLGWTAFGLLLTGIGAALFVFLPPAPRWSITGDVRQLLTTDDPAFATYTVRDGVARGPVQLWDLDTGQELDRFLTDAPTFLAYTSSHDGRYFGAVFARANAEGEQLAWVDLQERKAWHVKAELGVFNHALFSPTGNHVAVQLRGPPGPGDPPQARYTLVEARTGHVLARFVVPNKQEPPMPGDTGRWPDSVDFGQFTSDGRFFAVNRSDGEEPAIHLVETRSGKLTVVPDARLHALVPGSGALLAVRDGTAWIWDLAAMDWRAPLEADAPDTWRFSPDGRWLASVPPNRKEPVSLRFFDLRTGRLHWEVWSITVPCEGVQEEQFTPDTRGFLLPTEPAPGQRSLTLYDVPGKRMLWERTGPANFGSCQFTADASTLIHALPSQVEVIDAATGAARYTIDLPFSVQVDPWLSRDGRTLYVSRQPDLSEQTFWSELLERVWPRPGSDLDNAAFPLHAYDLATGRELWRQDTRFAAQLWFGADRVVTLHPQGGGNGEGPTLTTIECWDVPPRKRLGWIIGAPLGVGVVLLAARAGWRWRTRKQSG
jgi:hypothetical protein